MIDLNKTPLEATQKPRRRITEHDLEILAEHYRDGLNDTEACQLVGIHRDTWYQWKRRARNNSRFDAILARMKGNRIKWCFGKIEAAANKDFRAARELLSLTDPRFNDRAQQPAIVSNDGLAQLAQLGIDAAKLLMEGATRAKSRAVVEVQAKALPEPSKE